MEQPDALDYSTQASVGRCKGIGQLVAGMARMCRGMGNARSTRENSALHSTGIVSRLSSTSCCWGRGLAASDRSATIWIVDHC